MATLRYSSLASGLGVQGPARRRRRSKPCRPAGRKLRQDVGSSQSSSANYLQRYMRFRYANGSLMCSLGWSADGSSCRICPFVVQCQALAPPGNRGFGWSSMGQGAEGCSPPINGRWAVVNNPAHAAPAAPSAGRRGPKRSHPAPALPFATASATVALALCSGCNLG